MNIKSIIIDKPLKLDCGQTINSFPLAYETYGILNKKKEYENETGPEINCAVRSRQQPQQQPQYYVSTDRLIERQPRAGPEAQQQKLLQQQQQKLHH